MAAWQYLFGVGAAWLAGWFGHSAWTGYWGTGEKYGPLSWTCCCGLKVETDRHRPELIARVMDAHQCRNWHGANNGEGLMI